MNHQYFVDYVNYLFQLSYKKEEILGKINKVSINKPYYFSDIDRNSLDCLFDINGT